MVNKRSLGGEKEKIACDYLKTQGLRIVTTNYYCRNGEVDIIAKDGAYLTFIEVKYRKNTSMGHPLEAVTFKKQERIRRAATVYMMRNSMMDTVNCRFDVVAILDEDITWVKNAF